MGARQRLAAVALGVALLGAPCATAFTATLGGVSFDFPETHEYLDPLYDGSGGNYQDAARREVRRRLQEQGVTNAEPGEVERVVNRLARRIGGSPYLPPDRTDDDDDITITGSVSTNGAGGGDRHGGSIAIQGTGDVPITGSLVAVGSFGFSEGSRPQGGAIEIDGSTETDSGLDTIGPISGSGFVRGHDVDRTGSNPFGNLEGGFGSVGGSSDLNVPGGTSANDNLKGEGGGNVGLDFVGTDPSSNGAGRDSISGDSVVPVAGPDFLALFGNDPKTRLERFKFWIKTMFEAYLNGNVSGFQRAFGPDFIQDLGIFANAMQEDHQEQTDITIAFFINAVQATRDLITVLGTWRRNATDKNNGQALTPEEGEIRIIGSRRGGFRIFQLSGDLFFGRNSRSQNDTFFQQQKRVGQNSSSSGNNNLGPVSVNFNGNQAIVVDFEGRSFQVFNAGTFCPSCPLSSAVADLIINGFCSTSCGFDVEHGQNGSFNTSVIAGNQVSLCSGPPSSQSLSDFGNVVNLVNLENITGVSTNTSFVAVVGVLTTEGNYVLVELTFTSTGGLAEYNVSARFILSSTNPPGSGATDCG